MTRLIDKDYLIEEIRCSPVGQLLIRKHNLDGMIEKFPEVDAVPVQWLYDLAEKKEEEKDIKLSAMIKGVVALWHREKQEKQNG